MDLFRAAVTDAIRLIITLDTEVLTVTALSLRVAVTAVLAAALLGVPLAYFAATREFFGKNALLTLLNTLMALPTVIVGLFCYGILSRKGPLGFLDLLFTPTGIIIGDIILAFPLIAALTVAAVQSVDERARLTALSLGATPGRASLTVLAEARFGLAAALLNGFGRVIAEVGAAMILGGNIRGYTRTLTTAIALETGKGEFGFAMALGIILLTAALAVNLAFRRLHSRAG